MQITQNSWNKGMNSDLALTVPQNETALRLDNFRIVTDTGLSTYAITNVKGHNLSFTLPITSSVHNIVFAPTATNNTLNTPVTINGLTDIFTLSGATPLTTIYELLADFINNSAILQTGQTINAYAQPTGVLIYSPDVLSNMVVVVNASSLAGTWSSSTVVAAIGNFTVIGWTVIRDTIILATTDVISENPGGVDPNLPADPASAGQFWKIEYDNNDVATVTLLYNNVINFTGFHPIPSPGAIVGRYENSATQRVYWTDNFNRPRRINVADPNVFGTLIDSLDLQQNTSLGIPILQDIVQSGNVPTGMHQYAFRLKSNSGAETVFSMPSNMAVVIIQSETAGSFENRMGALTGLVSSKSMTYTIDGIDLNYDRIEIVDIYYNDATSTIPEINIIFDEPIPASGIFTFTHTGNETEIPISSEEFTTFSVMIRKVKTMVSKANRLFLGNIVEDRLDITYDARAYRYKADGTTYLQDDDSINPNQSPVSHEEGYIFQQPIPGQPLVFGGTGANISYEFVPDEDDIILANSDALNAQIVIDTRSAWNAPPYRDMQRDNYTWDLGTDQYPHVNTFRYFGDTYACEAIKGYMRDETYSFGIVFFDLLGNAGFVEWIGDIRMPHVFMPEPTNAVTAVTDNLRTRTFDTCRQSASVANQFEGYSLGIKFHVNIPANIKAQISGFAIVRCPRESGDKTILGQGIIEPAWLKNGTVNETYLVDDGPDVGFTIGTLPGDRGAYNNSTSLTALDSDFVSFFCPEHLFGKEAFNYGAGDAIDLVGAKDLDASGTLYAAAGLPHLQVTPFVHFTGFVNKNYTFANNPTYLYAGGSNYYGLMPLSGIFNRESWDIDHTSYITTRNTTGAPVTIYNVSVPHTVGAGNMVYSQGSQCLGLRSGNFSFGGNAFSILNALYGAENMLTVPTGGSWTPRSRVFVVNYKKAVANQYGGNTFNARSNRRYIPTGHYQPIDGNSPNTFDFTVYGGDTYVTAFDVTPRRCHWLGGDGFNRDTDYNTAKVRFAVIETTCNTELRENPGNRVPNKNFFPNNGTILDQDDDFNLNLTYERDGSATTYFPRPVPFSDLFEFDTRIRGSEVKENGELADSWTNFRPSVYLDAEGIYGPLNNLWIFNNAMLGFQDRAIGEATVDTRSLVNDTSGSPVQLGQAGLLSRYDYITTEAGCKHQWSMTMGNSHIFFLDALKRKIYRFGEGVEPLGEMKGLSGFLNTNMVGNGLYIDNPIIGNGMTSTFDYKFDEAIFTYHTTDVGGFPTHFTVSYNERNQFWNSFYDFAPPIYINSRNRILSGTDNQNFYQHNVGPYATYYGQAPSISKLKTVINPSPGTTKKFEMFTFNGDVIDESVNVYRKDDTWTRFRVYNSFQNTGFNTFIPKPLANFNVARNRKREWTMHIPRNIVISTLVNPNVLLPINLDATQLNKPRIYDNFVIADFEYDNLSNYKFVFPYLITTYR